MKRNESSYLDVFKSTSLFGSLQLLTMIVAVVRSKFVAVLLGPEGMGINGLLSSSTSLIMAFANLGISRSAVKNIAVTSKDGSNKKIVNVASALISMTWVLGLFSALLTFIFSGFLSEVSFGTDEFSFAFKWLSISILLSQLATSYEAVFRGMHKISMIAAATLKGSLFGLFISVPIYYVYGVEGLVPSIVLSSLLMYLINFYYYRKLNIRTSFLPTAPMVTEGKDMLRMGIILSISSVCILAESHYVRVFVRAYGSLEDVGFFNAGIAIINTYFGLFFASITMDYYPKLAAAASDNLKAIKLMIEQSEMTILIIAPFLVLFLVFIRPIVIILYSEEFLPLVELLLWASVGMFFKAASYALGVIFISKGDVKTLFWSEIVSTCVLFGLNLLGYLYYGLEGLGISFMLSNIYVYLQNYLLVKYRYDFCYSIDFLKLFSVILFLGLLAILSVKLFATPYNFVYGGCVLTITIYYCLIQLDKRINLFHILQAFINKRN
jgi:O-antigen/teichoic acid export membrane protein